MRKTIINKSILKSVLFSTAVLFTVGCSTKHANLPTSNSVDLNSYKGTWYEVARFEHFFEKGCKNVSATYNILKDDKIQVINRCTKIDTNKSSSVTGVAYATDDTNSKLKVSFFRPFYGDYWIIDVDKDYKTALVGAPSREYLWILSRSKTIDEKTKQRLLLKASSFGFDTNKFVWTIQD